MFSRLLCLVLFALMAPAHAFTGGTVVAAVRGSDCELCAQLATSALKKLPGVQDVFVDPHHEFVALGLDAVTPVEPEAVKLLLNRSGYALLSLSTSARSLADWRATHR